MAIFAGLFLKKPVATGSTNWKRPACPQGRSTISQQVFADPHVQSRGMRVKVEHPFEPELSLIRNAITFSGTPVKNIERRRCWRPHQGSAGDDRL